MDSELMRQLFRQLEENGPEFAAAALILCIFFHKLPAIITSIGNWMIESKRVRGDMELKKKNQEEEWNARRRREAKKIRRIKDQ